MAEEWWAQLSYVLSLWAGSPAPYHQGHLCCAVQVRYRASSPECCSWGGTGWLPQAHDPVGSFPNCQRWQRAQAEASSLCWSHLIADKWSLGPAPLCCLSDTQGPSSLLAVRALQRTTPWHHIVGLATHNRLLLWVSSSTSLHNAQAAPLLFLSHLTTTSSHMVVASIAGWQTPG